MNPGAGPTARFSAGFFGEEAFDEIEVQIPSDCSRDEPGDDIDVGETSTRAGCGAAKRAKPKVEKGAETGVPRLRADRGPTGRLPDNRGDELHTPAFQPAAGAP